MEQTENQPGSAGEHHAGAAPGSRDTSQPARASNRGGKREDPPHASWQMMENSPGEMEKPPDSAVLGQSGPLDAYNSPHTSTYCQEEQRSVSSDKRESTHRSTSPEMGDLENNLCDVKNQLQSGSIPVPKDTSRCMGKLPNDFQSKDMPAQSYAQSIIPVDNISPTTDIMIEHNKIEILLDMEQYTQLKIQTTGISLGSWLASQQEKRDTAARRSSGSMLSLNNPNNQLSQSVSQTNTMQRPPSSNSGVDPCQTSGNQVSQSGTVPITTQHAIHTLSMAQYQNDQSYEDWDIREARNPVCNSQFENQNLRSKIVGLLHKSLLLQFWFQT